MARIGVTKVREVLDALVPSRRPGLARFLINQQSGITEDLRELRADHPESLHEWWKDAFDKSRTRLVEEEVMFEPNWISMAIANGYEAILADEGVTTRE